MWAILLPLIVSLIMLIALPILYRNRKKTDKGFQFVYYGLSYRRKFIRTLWTLPFILLTIWFLFYIDVWSTTMKVLLSTFLVGLGIAQLGYNYYKMKQIENKE